MKQIPPISALMNPVVDSYQATLTIKEILHILEEKNYRHIPVVENKQLIGFLSARDLIGVDEMNTLGEICNRSIRIVPAEQRADEVLDIMWQQHIGSVLIQSDNKLAGIFTVTDACCDFAEFLRHHLLEEPLPYIIHRES